VCRVRHDAKNSFSKTENCKCKKKRRKRVQVWVKISKYSIFCVKIVEVKNGVIYATFGVFNKRSKYFNISVILYMSYSFNSKDEPATDIFFLNEDNKICHASVIMEGAGGSKNAGFIRMLYASKKNIDIDKMKNPSEHLKRTFPKTKKEPVIIKEEKKEKQKKIKVVDDINYQSVKNEIEFINNFLNSTRKENLKSDRQSEAFKKLLNAIEAYDYYPTPKEYGVKIYNEVLDMYKSGIKKINVLIVFFF
jgi:hypothetical protein